MKIVHIHQYFNEGYGYQENILPSYQKKLGHDVILITSDLADGHNNEPRKRKVGDFQENDFAVRRIKTYGEFKKRFVLFKKLYEELKKERPDYIYHHSPTAPSIVTVYKYKKNNPKTTVVVDNHADLQISGRNKLWKLFYYNFLWKNILKKVDSKIDHYFGVTPDRCLFLQKELGIKEEKISLLPIGSDNLFIDSVLENNIVIKELESIKQDNLLVCSGGKMTPNKKTEELIWAFKQLDIEKVKLVLFGSIEDDKLHNLIDQDEDIIFLGWRERKDVIKILGMCDMGVWANQHTTLLEDAVGCELPLVLREYGSTSHLIDKNGVFVQENKKEEIYSVLMDLLNQPSKIKKMKKEAKTMKEKLSYLEIAKQSIDRLEQ
ncbi:glycosyltransferase family 4 protein [Vagococcus lutrae]|uniref:glycosyltransferase family 4 protein n=1 Tax=Vagococcus lutrae TaxID=81947 RepID=UPI00200C307E|nr:glycosyltransferase family 4 protein [Vagococcus lutrae]UQF24040.1 glycosyltransferase family 4 protein [Vagococcus lutrae]UQF63869.1 glycosyltransferase family 4 protein [Vagococcus lutrae]